MQALRIVSADQFSVGIDVGVPPVIVRIHLGELLAARPDDVPRRLHKAVARDVATHRPVHQISVRQKIAAGTAFPGAQKRSTWATRQDGFVGGPCPTIVVSPDEAKPP